MSSGWVSIQRSIQNHWVWDCEFSYGQAWVDLILSANHKEAKINIKGQIVKIERGQQARSELTLASVWKWSRGKVRRFLKNLVNDGMIIIEATHLTTIITICNYSDFQSYGTTGSTTNDTTNGTTNGTADGTADEHLAVQQTDIWRYTNNNVNNVNNVNNENNENKKTCLAASAKSDNSPVSELFDFWVGIMKKDFKRTKLTKKRKAAITNRLKEGYTTEDIRTAITNCSQSDFHMGANDRNTEYNDIELICRSGEKLENFRDSVGVSAGMNSNQSAIDAFVSGDFEMFSPREQAVIDSFANEGVKDIDAEHTIHRGTNNDTRR